VVDPLDVDQGRHKCISFRTNPDIVAYVRDRGWCTTKHEKSEDDTWSRESKPNV